MSPPPLHGEDLALVARVRAGDRAAALEVLRRAQQAVAWARRRLSASPQAAEEVELVLGAALLLPPHAPLRGYAGRGALFAWLATTALRALTREERRRQRFTGPALEELLERGVNPSLPPEEEAVDPLVQAALQEALATLEPGQRAALAEEGASLEALAARDQVSRATAARRRRAARRALLEALTRRLEVLLDRRRAVAPAPERALVALRALERASFGAAVPTAGATPASRGSGT